MRIYAEVLNYAIKKYSVKIFHFVLMANHYHIIIQTPEENLHRFFQFVNSRVALLYNKREKRSGHLWGERYKSTILSTDEHYLKCIRYIYLNPVRAGVIANPDQWEDSTFHFHAFGQDVKINLAEDQFFIMITKSNKRKYNYSEEFQNLFDDLTNCESELRTKLCGRFFGPGEFLEKMRMLYCIA
jgi:putative transposase